MSKKIQKSTNKISKITEATLEEFKDMLVKNLHLEEDPNNRIKELKKIFEERSTIKSQKRKKELAEKINSFTGEVFNILSLSTKSHLALSTDSDSRGFTIEAARLLEKEFNAEKPSEKMLVQMAVCSYVRMMKCAKFFNNNMEGTITNERANLIGRYSKEADRCFRQYLSAIQMLHQLKTPPLKVNVKTQNAFIAQNQQNNSNPNNNENIDPQSFRKSSRGTVSENIVEGTTENNEDETLRGDSEAGNRSSRATSEAKPDKSK